jgi:hypothetical protein
LVIKQGESLRAFEVKWSSQRRIHNRAFEDAYGVKVERIHSADPFATKFFEEPA